MDFRILGPLEVYEGDDAIPLGGAKQRALLAVLLLSANEVVSTDRLIDELWGERPPGSAAHSIEVYVSRLRRVLDRDRPRGSGGKLLRTRRPGYVLALAPDQLDLDRFQRLVADGRQALAEGDPQLAVDTLKSALALWRGSPLADFAFESFAQSAISRLEELRLAALEDRIEADLALGRHADLVGELEELIARHPFRERPRAQLMLALYRSRRQAEALEAYTKVRTVLSVVGVRGPLVPLGRYRLDALEAEGRREPALLNSMGACRRFSELRVGRLRRPRASRRPRSRSPSRR